MKPTSLAMTLSVALAFVALSMGCPKDAEVADIEPVVSGSPVVLAQLEPEPPADPRTYMQRQYQALTRTRDALLAGNLAAFRNHSAAIAQAPTPTAGLPQDWFHHITGQMFAADSGADARDLASAGHALGAIVVACADCHAATGETTRVVAAPGPPADNATTRDYMRRHNWVVTEMWAGIFGPDEAAWGHAAAVVEQAPLRDAPAAHDTWRKQSLCLASDVSALAKLGRSAKPAERPAIFGRMMAACASCHQAQRIASR